MKKLEFLIYLILILSVVSIETLRLMRIIKKELKIDRDKDLMPSKTYEILQDHLEMYGRRKIWR